MPNLGIPEFEILDRLKRSPTTFTLDQTGRGAQVAQRRRLIGVMRRSHAVGAPAAQHLALTAWAA
jgi:hypothetical protein